MKCNIKKKLIYMLLKVTCKHSKGCASTKLFLKIQGSILKMHAPLKRIFDGLSWLKYMSKIEHKGVVILNLEQLL